MIGAADTFGDDSNDSIVLYRSDSGRNFEICVTVELNIGDHRHTSARAGTELDYHPERDHSMPAASL